AHCRPSGGGQYRLSCDPSCTDGFVKERMIVMKQHVTIQWLGHSCFKITAEGSSVVLDPYADCTVPGLSPLHISGGQVYCSHEHPDHNAADLVKPENDYHHSPFAVQVFPSYHDNVRGLRR